MRLALLALILIAAPAAAGDAPSYTLRPDGSVALVAVAPPPRATAAAPCECGPRCDCGAPCGCDRTALTRPTPPASVCRVLVARGRGAEACGMGTVVGCEGGQSLVVTNRHVIASGGAARVEIAGRSYPVAAASTLPGSDLAGLLVAAELPAAVLAPADPAPGAEVRHWGQTTGPARGTVRGPARDAEGGPAIAASYHLVSGDSGSGVFDARGRLVGVNWGFDGTYSARGPSSFVPVSAVRRYITEYAGPFPRLRARLAGQGAVPPAPVTPAPKALECPDGKCPRPAPGVRVGYDRYGRPVILGDCPGGRCPPVTR